MRWGIALLALGACEGADAPDPPGLPTWERACDEAAARVGERVCVHAVPDRATWDGISLPGATLERLQATKFLVPVRPDDPVPPLFMDVGALTMHVDLLARGFPDAHAGLTPGGYAAMSLYPQGRRYWSGVVTEWLVDEGTRFAFTVWDDPADPTSTVTEADALAVHRVLQARFGLAPLAFEPGTPAQQEAARAWTSGLPVFDPAGVVDVEAYTPGEAWGYVRRIRLADLAEAEAGVAFGAHDVLVTDVAPADVLRPVAAAVTGSRQSELSHLNLRSAARGTPNCYLRDAWEALARWEGELVHLVCAPGALTVTAGARADAEAWWAAHRPDPVALVVPDAAWTAMEGLDEVPVATAADRRAALRRYGAKGANLAVLYDLVDPGLQFDGFLVPFSAYLDHLATARWTVDLGAGPEEVTFAETLDAWLDDEAFLADPALRRDRLVALHDALAASPPSPALVEAVAERAEEVFGAATTTVRLRSSSNAEDALAFSGAGLYTSVRACPADDLDGDDLGPSRCDPRDPRERTVAAGLAAVWASAWGVAAFEERAFYGMDHRRVAMGVLVNDRAASERANLVAFSGVPGAPGDDRVLINAQLGDLEVVSTDPGVIPERVLVDLAVAPPVIRRAAPSTVMPPGQWILDDATVLRVARTLDALHQTFPVDEAPPEGAQVLIDTEWKILADGRLVVKQARPFLRAGEVR